MRSLFTLYIAAFSTKHRRLLVGDERFGLGLAGHGLIPFVGVWLSKAG